MASPIKPSDIDAAVPGIFSNICAGFKSLFLLGPLIKQFWHFAFDSDGNATADFKALFVSIGVPVGGVLWWPVASFVPEGWIVANGQAVSRASYPSLFQVIGTSFGAGDGSTTFNLPQCAGRFLFGTNASHPVGETGGEETHILTVAELAKHSHIPNIINTEISGSGDVPDPTIQMTGTGPPGVPPQLILSDAGSNAPHQNLPPYITGVWIIKT